MPIVVYVLALGTFLMGTTEFVVAGLLPDMARDLDVSVARAGLSITVFAAGMIIGAPLVVIGTRRLPQRLTLLIALGVFAAGHVIAALSPALGLVLVARFATALATGAFWSVAAVVGSDSVDTAVSGRALGVVLGGGMFANVIGVPLGALVGQHAGWRTPFWAMAALAAGASVLVARQVVHDVAATSQPPLTSELASLRSGRLWLVLAACATTTGGTLAMYSYVSPLLTDRAGVPDAWVPAVLVAFGAGAFIGTILGGRLGDTRPHAATVTAAVATTSVLGAIALVSHHAWPVAVLMVPLGLFSMGANPILISFAVRYAAKAPTLAAAMATSTFNLGTAIGSWLAGRALDSSLAEIGPVVVGTSVAALTIVPVAIIALIERTATRPHADASSAHV